MARHFITFGNRRFRQSRERLRREAEALGVFDSARFFTPRDFDPDFWAAHGEFMERHGRGFGFYIWKPYFVRRTLLELGEGDVLVYADAGCKIYPQYRPRLLEYFEMLTAESTGMLSFQLRSRERAYTKADLAARLGVLDRPEFMDARQVAGTVQIIRRCPHAEMVVGEWLAIATEDYHLIDNTPSRLPNHPEFREHRFDQSIISLLVKIHGALIIPDETYPPGSGPISANRIRC